MASLGWLGLWLMACGDAVPRVGLQPMFGRTPSCGHAADGRLLLITAQTGDREVTRSIALDGSVTSVDIADFPVDTKQLTVELIGSSGAVRAVGKSAPLDFAALLDGGRVPVYMAPPGGGCLLPDLQQPRRQPMIAAAGNGALVVGGTATTGAQVSAEYFDPLQHAFVPIDLPAVFASASTLQGSALATMPDGRVALFAAGTGAYALFDPVTQQFGKPRVFEPRWQFAAVAVDPTRVAVVGGCRSASQGACTGDAAARVLLVDVGADDVDLLGNLALDHLGPDVVLEPATATRGPALLVVGGVTLQGLPSVAAERMDLTTGAVVMVPAAGRAIALDSGATLTGFAAPAAAASDAMSLLIPGSTTRRGATADRARHGPALALQEDGRVLIAGGGAGLSLFEPTTSSFRAVTPTGDPLLVQDELATVRLRDGSILVVGGANNGVASASAWRYRPSLVGPFTASVLLSSGLSDTSLTPLDNAELAIPNNQFVVSGPGPGPTVFAVVGGPRRSAGTVQAVVAVAAPTTGFALAMHYRGPAAWLGFLFQANQPVTVVERNGAITTTLCTGRVVAASALAAATDVEIRLQGRTATATVAGDEVLRCDLPTGIASAAGAIAIAGFGDGGAAVSQLTVGPSGN
ncbi:MAG: hypothetical protein KBG15_10475 [Kofleriaceae bacterium]|nr:hypothetical protein [Kofleriaceae bacterium]